MMDSNGSASSTVKSASENKILGIPRKFLLIGGGCLAFLCICLVAAALIYFYVIGGFGGNPIPALAPADSVLIMSVDLLKLQSSDVRDIAQVFQDLAGVDTGLDMIETLDESMYSEMNMTFTDDVLPWIGQYAGLIVYDYDPNSYDVPEISFVVSVRNKSKADAFIEDLVPYLEDSSYDRYESVERDGVTFYSSQSGDMTIARSGSQIFFGTSQAAIRNSIGLKKTDSLAGTDGYKKAIAALPKGQLATMYVDGRNFQKYFDFLWDDSGLSYSLNIYGTDLFNFKHIAGVALGISTSKDGLRLDYATALNPDKLSASQLEALNIKYSRSNIENMVPEDTFVFSALKSSKGPGYLLERGGLLDNPDIQESLDLLEREYDFSLQDFLDSLSGEYGLAISPARDGIMAESDINVGITFIAGITDQSNLTDMILDFLDTNLGYVDEYSVESVTYGKYDLQGLIIDEFDYRDPTVVFGEDNGYFILGTSPANLNDSLGGTRSLADSAKYRQTWKAFSSGSIPVLYVDLVALVDLIYANDPYAFEYDMPGVPNNIDKVPVFAISRNKASKYVPSTSIMLFVDTGK
jgi:hypothetical protein